MTEQDINDKLRTFIRETLAMPADTVRPANQTAPTGKQNEPFATVLITMIDDEGQDDRVLANDAAPALTVTETLVGQRRLTASVQFFRGDAYTQACRLNTRMSLSSVVDKLAAMNMGFIRATPARNLTAVIDQAWEPRAQIDLDFYVTASESQALPTVGRVPITVHSDSSTTSSEVISP